MGMNISGGFKEDGIKLGDKVRCRHTGFTGIAVGRTLFINGCVQYLVVPRVGKDNKLEDDQSIDAESLEVINPRPKKTVQTKTGGHNRKIARRNF